VFVVIDHSCSHNRQENHKGLALEKKIDVVSVSDLCSVIRTASAETKETSLVRMKNQNARRVSFKFDE
jgi:hypothetical protein